MIGIEAVSYYICEYKESNIGKIFDGEVIDSDFIKNRVGIESIAIKQPNETTSDLCIKAFQNLTASYKHIDLNEIDCVCLCTRYGDYVIPHTSAVLQHRLGLKENCATFDIHLGCTGYIYSIDIMKNFMQGNGYKKGLLFTCEPVSDFMDKTDKNTSILFGDAATVTLLSDEPVLDIQKSTYYTFGEHHITMNRKQGGKLHMDGHTVFYMALQNVPKVALKNLESNNLKKEDIDLFIFHQPNKYMIEAIAKRMKLDLSIVPIDIKEYGNTNSSSIPIILSKHMNNEKYNVFHLSSIGDGISIASVPVIRITK